MTSSGQEPIAVLEMAFRQMKEQEATAKGGLLNPQSAPRGIGHWEWLDPVVDRQRAQVLGYTSPAEVLQARGKSPGDEHVDQPAVVWYPRLDLLNPVRQPLVSGHWDFLSNEDQETARHKLGWLDCQPVSASRISSLRANCRFRVQRGEQPAGVKFNFTDSISLVYVPDEGHAYKAAKASVNDSVPSTWEEDVGFGIDKFTKLAHDPRNGGEYDQTSSNLGKAVYQTRELGGKKVTVDRSRALPGGPQESKYWMCDSAGDWVKWGKADVVDWSDKASLECLNKWREQFASRNKWPLKRQNHAPGYTETQRQWVFSHVVSNKGKKPKEGPAAFRNRYAAQFPNDIHRDEKGVIALYDRLIREYKDYGGQMKPRLLAQAAEEEGSKDEDDKNDEEEDANDDEGSHA